MTAAAHGALLRRATAKDREEIVALVLRVVDDVDYASLSPVLAAELAANARALVDGPWELAHVLVVDDHIRGVVLTGLDVVDDLWLDRTVRRRGFGTALLARGLDEIAARGFPVARLRVVASNTAAVAFYLARGWREVGRVRHERFGYDMLRMELDLAR